MKTLTLLFLVSLFALTAQSQAFEDIIGTKQNDEIGVCATIDVDGNLLVGGRMGTNTSILPLLLKFNSEGALDAKLTIPEFVNLPHINLADMEALHDADGNANGYILVFKYSAYVVIARFNNYGNIVWAKQTGKASGDNFGKLVQPIYSPVTNQLNGFYLTLYWNGNTLLKLSSDGTLLWQKHFEYPHLPTEFGIYDILADDEDGGCLVAGNLEPGNPRPVVLKFSPYGKLLWGKRYYFPGSSYGARVSAMAVTKGGYIISGEEYKNFSPTFTMKISRTGDIIWANDYYIPQHYNDPHNLITDSSGNIIFAGPYAYNPLYYYPDTVRKPYIIKLDSVGNVVFAKRYRYNFLLNDVKFAPGGGYYAIGNNDFQNSNFPAQLYVIRTDANGNIANSCEPVLNLPFKKTPTQVEIGSNTDYTITDDTLTLTDITALTTQKIFQGLPEHRCGTTATIISKDSKPIFVNNLSVSPNPSHGTITVTYNAGASNNIQLNVYDKTGRVMFTKKEQAVKGKNMYQLNLSNLINGLYNLQLINGSEQNQVKVVIEK